MGVECFSTGFVCQELRLCRNVVVVASELLKPAFPQGSLNVSCRLWFLHFSAQIRPESSASFKQKPSECFHPVVFPGRVKFSFCKLSIFCSFSIMHVYFPAFYQTWAVEMKSNHVWPESLQLVAVGAESSSSLYWCNIFWLALWGRESRCAQPSPLSLFLFVLFIFLHFYSSRSMFVREVFAWMGGGVKV